MKSMIFIKLRYAYYSQIAYDGFSYGHAAEEMQRHLTVGEHVLNMGGVSIKISVDTSLHHHLCGAVFVLFEVDPSKGFCNTYVISKLYNKNIQFP